MTTGYELDEFAPHAYKIQVDPDPAILEREAVGVAQKIRCDVALFIDRLAAAVERESECAAWRAQCAEWKERYAVRREPHVINDGPVNFYEFADVLSDSLHGNETVVADAGSAYYVMGQAFKVKRDQRYIVSGSLGTMGYTLPAALGVCAANPNTMAVGITGDGSLQSNIHELQVMRHHAPNLKLFVINNDGYASIRNTQAGFFGGHYVGCSRDSGVSLPPLDRIALAYELPYVLCENRAALRRAISDTLRMDGPVVCGITAQPDQQIIPTVSSVRLPSGVMKSKPLHEMFPFLDEQR